jgi:hypothetical protein
VMLRYGGWPERCELCGQPLDYLTYGWLVEREPGGALAIVHVVCPTRAQQLQGQGPSR